MEKNKETGTILINRTIHFNNFLQLYKPKIISIPTDIYEPTYLLPVLVEELYKLPTRFGQSLDKYPFRLTTVYVVRHFNGSDEFNTLAKYSDMVWDFKAVSEDPLHPCSVYTESTPYLGTTSILNPYKISEGSAKFGYLVSSETRKKFTNTTFCYKFNNYFIYTGNGGFSTIQQISLPQPRKSIIGIIEPTLNLDLLTTNSPFVQFYTSYLQKLSKLNCFPDEILLWLILQRK